MLPLFDMVNAGKCMFWHLKININICFGWKADSWWQNVPHGVCVILKYSFHINHSEMYKWLINLRVNFYFRKLQSVLVFLNVIVFRK